MQNSELQQCSLSQGRELYKDWLKQEYFSFCYPPHYCIQFTLCCNIPIKFRLQSLFNVSCGLKVSYNLIGKLVYKLRVIEVNAVILTYCLRNSTGKRSDYVAAASQSLNNTQRKSFIFARENEHIRCIQKIRHRFRFLISPQPHRQVFYHPLNFAEILASTYHPTFHILQFVYNRPEYQWNCENILDGKKVPCKNYHFLALYIIFLSQPGAFFIRISSESCVAAVIQHLLVPFGCNPSRGIQKGFADKEIDVRIFNNCFCSIEC